jgi:hypothetical protein
MWVAGVILEPRAAQSDRDSHQMELLKAIVAEVVARHMAPVLPASRAVVIAANIVYQNHLRAIVACSERSVTCVKRRLFGGKCSELGCRDRHTGHPWRGAESLSNQGRHRGQFLQLLP